MSFYARNFIFDGKASQGYSLTISSDSGEQSSNNAGDVKLYTEKLYRRTDEFLLGTSIEPMLEFPVTFMTTDLNELSAQNAEIISKWLFGRRNYCKLQIMQEDMQDVFYDCFLLSPKIIRVGNIIRGFSATVKCKSAWGLTNPRTFTYNFISPVVDQIVIHNNMSDDTGYTYPTTITLMDGVGGNVSVINLSDNNREFNFVSLSANEVLTVDNSLQIMTSSTGLSRINNFKGLRFFRLVNGINRLKINGNISQFKIVYPLARKIGG